MLPHSAGRRAANVRHPGASVIRVAPATALPARLGCRLVLPAAPYAPNDVTRSSPGPETSRFPEILVKLDLHHWIGDRARGRSALRQTRLAPAGPGRTGLGSRLRVWAAFGQKASPVLRATSCALEPRSTNNDARVTDDPSRTSMAVAIVALCPLEPARVCRRL